VNPYVSLHQNAREKTRVKLGRKLGRKTRVKMLKKKVLGRSRWVSWIFLKEYRKRYRWGYRKGYRKFGNSEFTRNLTKKVVVRMFRITTSRRAIFRQRAMIKPSAFGLQSPAVVCFGVRIPR
jgi:hypothetical protein